MTINPSASRECPVVCFQGNRKPRPDRLPLIREAPLSIQINNQPFLRTTRTPIDDELLALGILFAEGIITSAGEINDIQLQPGAGNKERDNSEDILLIKVPGFSPPGQKSTTTTTTLSRQVKTIPAGWDKEFSFQQLSQLPQIMTAHQHIYTSSRAAHAVGIFNQKGDLVTCQEDVSRTNALHKALGFCLRHQLEWKTLIAVFSGRINLDMAGRIARAGFPLILSISAPTDSAIKILNQAGITYIGSLRNNGGILYTPDSSLTITS